MREQQPSPHLTRIFGAAPNMQAIRVISESGAAGGPRPAGPRGETATVFVRARARHRPPRAEDHARARARLDAVAERLP